MNRRELLAGISTVAASGLISKEAAAQAVMLVGQASTNVVYTSRLDKLILDLLDKIVFPPMLYTDKGFLQRLDPSPAQVATLEALLKAKKEGTVS